jgi:hypothetical protein
VIDHNAALAAVCVQHKPCLFDGKVGFNSSFTAADVATVTNTAGLNTLPFNVIPVVGPAASQARAGARAHRRRSSPDGAGAKRRRLLHALPVAQATVWSGTFADAGGKRLIEGDDKHSQPDDRM